MKTFSCGGVADSDGEFDRSDACDLHSAWMRAVEHIDSAIRLVREDSAIEEAARDDPRPFEDDSERSRALLILREARELLLEFSIPEEDEEPDGEDDRKERETR